MGMRGKIPLPPYGSLCTHQCYSHLCFWPIFYITKLYFYLWTTHTDAVLLCDALMYFIIIHHIRLFAKERSSKTVKLFITYASCFKIIPIRKFRFKFMKRTKMNKKNIWVNSFNKIKLKRNK